LELIYTNNINESVGGKISKFGDDTKIYHKVTSDEELIVWSV